MPKWASAHIPERRSGGWFAGLVFITRMANGKTCFGDSHTRPSESESHWLWFLHPSVVIDAEGVQNIEQGGEEGEELEKDREH